ncbi:aminoglycoside phosphotransferase family protein [Oryzifoliimicrobium ureilyticus]|uniref:aminoglycoside phosphotransferase family protein n=1 Tax=Oryzifoliimicrobium ureilyticus TaxID=3113724 RepID=UPI0030767D60
MRGEQWIERDEKHRYDVDIASGQLLVLDNAGGSLMADVDPAVVWAKEQLGAHGVSALGEPALVRAVPWSRVYRFETQEGRFYLKVSAPAFAREAGLIGFLAPRFADAVLPVLAHDADLGAFLMPDGGEPLRVRLKDGYDRDLVCGLLGRYGRMQQVLATDVDGLLALGLQDWRMAIFPKFYADLVADEDLLTGEGFTIGEIDALRKRSADVHRLCRMLEAFGIPETLEHCDFHDNNVLVREGKFVINDWGDAVITHPFFSLASFLDSATRHHGFDPASNLAGDLKRAYFEVWLAQESLDQLERILCLVQTLRPLEFCFNFRRVRETTGVEGFQPYMGHIGAALRRFLAMLGQS